MGIPLLPFLHSQINTQFTTQLNINLKRLLQLGYQQRGGKISVTHIKVIILEELRKEYQNPYVPQW